MSCTVREAKEKLDGDEFDDMVLFYREYPPINFHLTTMLSQVCHTTWVANFKKGMKRLKPKDFMPDYKATMLTQEDKAREAVNKLRLIGRGSKYITVKEEC